MKKTISRSSLTKQQILDSNFILKHQKSIYRHAVNPFLQIGKVGSIFIFRAYGVNIEEVKNKNQLLILTSKHMGY